MVNSGLPVVNYWCRKQNEAGQHGHCQRLSPFDDLLCFEKDPLALCIIRCGGRWLLASENPRVAPEQEVLSASWKIRVCQRGCYEKVGVLRGRPDQKAISRSLSWIGPVHSGRIQTKPDSFPTGCWRRRHAGPDNRPARGMGMGNDWVCPGVRGRARRTYAHYVLQTPQAIILGCQP